MELNCLFNRFERNIKEIKNELKRNIKEMKNELKELEEDFIKTQNKTLEFLDNCQKVGIKRVGINMRDEKFEESKNWPFTRRGMVFADERYEGWPAIWRAVEMTKDIKQYCGNSGQYQCDTQFLQSGIYEFKNGKWYLVKESDNQ